jgi:hypothetical protein
MERITNEGVAMEGTKCALLPFAEEFVEDLVLAANNPNMARNLLDQFPQPYSRQDALDWVSFCRHNENGRRFCICVARKSEGGDTEESSGGRWLAVGGIEAKEVAGANSNLRHRVERNKASGRVLEKTGFELEARERMAYVKQDQYLDALVYVLFREPPCAVVTDTPREGEK